MNIQNIKSLLTGLTIPQEYVCLDALRFESPFSINLSIHGRELRNVSHRCVFVGYKPVLFIVDALLTDGTATCSLNFYHENAQTSTSHPVARLSLRLIQSFDDYNCDLYEATHGEHNFIAHQYQMYNRIRRSLQRTQPGNVGLPGNLIEQVRIAYAVPRPIALMIVADQKSMNIFPTDLHGSIHNRYYVSSLRLGGKANDQVMQHKRVLVALLPVEEYRKAYALGKNHTREMQPERAFNHGAHRSRNFNFPLPEKWCSYFELVQVGFFDIGIHRIHFYRIDGTETLPTRSILSHIHQYALQWRINHVMPTEYFLR